MTFRAHQMLSVFAFAALGLSATACRRGADVPSYDVGGDLRGWTAPPGMGPAEADAMWLRRVLGDHHDYVRVVDDRALASDPAYGAVFERVRGRVHPNEQRLTAVALGGPGCSVAGGCRDTVHITVGPGMGERDPEAAGWVLIKDVAGGYVYARGEVADPLLIQWDEVLLQATGADAERVYNVVDGIGGPPDHVFLGNGMLAVHEHTGGYYFRANPQAGHGRGIVRSVTWLGTGAGMASQNATVFEDPSWLGNAVNALPQGAATIDGPNGQVVHQSGTLLVTRAEAVVNAEQLMQPPATPPASNAPAGGASKPGGR